jgi:hypothetical protein
MTDEIPQEPIDTEIVPTEQPTPNKMPSVLSTLPPEIIEEMDTRLMGGEKVTIVREDMIKKYPAIEGLKASYLTWSKRARKLKSESSVNKDIAAKKELGSVLPTTEELEMAVKAAIDPTLSLDNKKAAMEALFKESLEQYKVLREKQKNYLNPEYQALMIATMKFSSEMIEKATKYREVLNKDLEADTLKRTDEMIRNMFQLSYQAYSLTHPMDPNHPESNKFDSFRITLEELVATFLKNYTSLQKPA